MKMRSTIACVGFVLFSTLTVAAADAEVAAKKCRYVNLKTLPITFADRLPIVEGSVNGKAISMLVDTGARQTMLTRSGAEDLGLKIGPSSRSSYGIGGESSMYRARLDEISIGPVKRGAITLMVLWDLARKPPFGVVVGSDFLFQRDLEIALADRRMAFFHPLECNDAFLAYWDRNAFVAEFGPAGALGDPPHIVVDVNGQKVRAIIDTGASRSVIGLAAAARAGVTPQSAGVVEGRFFSGIGTRAVPSWIAPFETVVVGSATIRNTRIAIADIWGAAESDIGYRIVDRLREGPEMILGLDFLKAHRVLMAMSQRRVYFSYLGGAIFDIAE